MSYLDDMRNKLKQRAGGEGTARVTGTSERYFDPKEPERYSLRLNKIMAGEPGFSPIATPEDLWRLVSDGNFMCRLLNKCQTGAVPDAVLERKTKATASAFANSEAATHFIACCKGIGLETTGIGAGDFTRVKEQRTEHVIMGILWQMLRRQLANEIKLILKKQEEEAERRGKKLRNYSANMARVLKDPEAYLCEWVNETMAAKGVPLANGGKGASNMSELSLGGSDTLLRLMHALDPHASTVPTNTAGLDGPARAAAAMDWCVLCGGEKSFVRSPGWKGNARPFPFALRTSSVCFFTPPPHPPPPSHAGLRTTPLPR